MLGSEVEKGGQTCEGNAGIIFCDDPDILSVHTIRTTKSGMESATYVFYYPRMQVFPVFIIREDFCSA